MHLPYLLTLDSDPLTHTLHTSTHIWHPNTQPHTTTNTHLTHPHYKTPQSSTCPLLHPTQIPLSHNTRCTHAIDTHHVHTVTHPCTHHIYTLCTTMKRHASKHACTTPSIYIPAVRSCMHIMHMSAHNMHKSRIHSMKTHSMHIWHSTCTCTHHENSHVNTRTVHT